MQMDEAKNILKEDLEIMKNKYSQGVAVLPAGDFKKIREWVHSKFSIQALQFFLDLAERIGDGEKITEILCTTKLGKGHNFSNSTDFDLFLKDWRIDNKEIALLAQAITHYLGKEEG